MSGFKRNANKQRLFFLTTTSPFVLCASPQPRTETQITLSHDIIPGPGTNLAEFVLVTSTFDPPELAAELQQILTAFLWSLVAVLNNVDGFRREFDLTDPHISHKYKSSELVPGYALHLIAFVAPLVLMWTINLLMVKSWWDGHSAALGLTLGLAMTSVTTHLVKVTVGRPRPGQVLPFEMLPIPGAANHPANEYFGLATSAVCTQTDRLIMRDGWRSFWSGHSSESFAGLSFLSYYMAGKLHMFDQQGYTASPPHSSPPVMSANQYE
ncbi:hypothetical protein FRC06_011487 [Ceratobasidium sp. 370]|nr:hypothetical protein FRC06_011487 [Ceratobasidium sp. 370]